MLRFTLRVLTVLVLAAVIGMLIPQTVVAQNGVDALRGRWDITLTNVPEAGAVPGFKLFVNDLAPKPGVPDTYVAAGCFETPGWDFIAPASLEATAITPEMWRVSFYTTVMSPDGWAEVQRFDATVLTYGSGVQDDGVIDAIVSIAPEMSWEARHHDRRRTHCPPANINPGLWFNVDVYTHDSYYEEFAYNTSMLLEGFSNIVASGMLVIAPDGTEYVIPMYTDLFSPQVDFINEFRFLLGLDQTPIVGEPYTFFLLDALGNRIAGTEQTDVWLTCHKPVPKNLALTVEDDNSLILTWDAVDPPPDFYQFNIWPWDETGSGEYGTTNIHIPEHLIPWASFGGGQEGSPDGWDYGNSLEELTEGQYHLVLQSFNAAPEGGPEQRLTCASYNNFDMPILERTATGIVVLPPG